MSGVEAALPASSGPTLPPARALRLLSSIGCFHYNPRKPRCFTSTLYQVSELLLKIGINSISRTFSFCISLYKRTDFHSSYSGLLFAFVNDFLEQCSLIIEFPIVYGNSLFFLSFNGFCFYAATRKSIMHYIQSW